MCYTMGLGRFGLARPSEEPVVKIVHAADLHIDSPLRGLTRYEGAPVEQIRGATRRALENLVELCLAEEAVLLLLAGDVFDGDWRDYATGLFFAAQMARLRQAGVRVVTLRGNHDAVSQIHKELRLPENVRELSAKKPESVLLEEIGVAVHGQGFGKRAVPEDLAARYPAPVAGLFNIGLLHTSLTGRPGHDPYAPTTLDVLRGKGYDYWALGHVHTREVVCEDPYVVFPGNLQGRHAREVGPKGASVLTIEGGRLRDLRHEPLDAVRWAVCEIDVSAAADGHDVVELVHGELSRQAAATGGRLLAARVVLRGQTRAQAELASEPERFRAQIEACALDVTEGPVWLERVVLETRSPSVGTQATEREDAIGQLVQSLDALGNDPSELAALAAIFAELKRKLPREAGEGEGALRLDDPEFFATLLPEVRELLLARLLEGQTP
jgi:DNA repair exonuclease SbcCD nuclease subunit